MAAVTVLLGMAAVVGDVLAQPEPNRARSRSLSLLGDLPEPIVVEIVFRLDPHSAAWLAATCRLLHGLCHPLIRFWTAPVSALPSLLAASNDSYHLTPEQCVDLYDRVLESGDLSNGDLLDLMAVLARRVPSFSDFLVSLRVPMQPPDYERFGLAIQLAEIPAEPVRPGPIRLGGDVDALVRTASRTITERFRNNVDHDQRRYRLTQHILDLFLDRYPNPFNQVFFFTQIVAEFLLTMLPDRSILAQRDVVLALARYGIRFDLFQFLIHVPVPEQAVRALYPFLLKDRLAVEIGQLLHTIDWKYHEPLLRLPAFLAVLERDPVQVAVYVANMLDRYPHRLRDIGRLLRPDNRILNAAIVNKDIGVIGKLLELPFFDLYTEAGVPGSVDTRPICPLDLLLNDRELAEAVVTIPSFRSAVSKHKQ